MTSGGRSAPVVGILASGISPMITPGTAVYIMCTGVLRKFYVGSKSTACTTSLYAQVLPLLSGYTALDIEMR